MTTILKVDPGSTISMIARFFVVSTFASPGRFGLNAGRVAMASTSPVRGRTKTAVIMFGFSRL